MIRRLWGLYVGLIGVAAGVFVAVLIVAEAWRGNISVEATPAQLLLALLLAPVLVLALSVLFVLLSFVAPGPLPLVALVAAPGFLVAGVVMLLQGDPASAAWVVLFGLLLAAAYFLIPVVEDVLRTLLLAIAWGLVALFSLPLSALRKVGAQTALVDCPTCGVEKRAIKRTNVVFHVVYTIATAGVWLPFWFVLSKRHRFRCLDCRTALPNPPGYAVPLRVFERSSGSGWAQEPSA